MVSLPGDCHATLAMTLSALHGKEQIPRKRLVLALGKGVE